MRDSMAAAIAANRFGLGARPGELDTIAHDPRGWLTAQLTGPAPLITDPDLHDTVYVVSMIEEMRSINRDARAAAMKSGGAMAASDVGNVNNGAIFGPQYTAEVLARLQQGATTERPFVERLVQFWSNHFAVSVDKGDLTGLAGCYEREVIRPHVLGNFSDLLLAAETHPAMLTYLDNFRSTGPGSQAAQKARNVGINENLAREILELHTLGVDGGYSQADVTAFARVISGWSVGTAEGGFAGGGLPGTFAFRSNLHEPGTQQVDGRQYEEAGQAQGRAVLDDLARHPATAHHLATKLARQFIADEPPDEAVRNIARAFSDSNGHLPTVYQSVVNQAQAWQQPLPKYKTPSDYVFSVYRALQLPATPPDKGAQGIFETLGQRTWMPTSPAGYADRSADWDGGSALMKRLQWAGQLGQRLGAKLDARALAPQLLGDTLTVDTRTALGRAASGGQALMLLLASPEFMHR